MKTEHFFLCKLTLHNTTFVSKSFGRKGFPVWAGACPSSRLFQSYCTVAHCLQNLCNNWDGLRIETAGEHIIIRFRLILLVEIILWRDHNLKFPTKNFPLVDLPRDTYFLLMRSYRRDDVRSWCHIGALTPSLLIPTIYKHGTLCWGESYFCH